MTSASIFVTPALGDGPEGAAPPTPPETPPSPCSVLRGQQRCRSWCCGRLGAARTSPTCQLRDRGHSVAGLQTRQLRLRALFSDVFLLCDVNSSKSSGCILQAPKGGGDGRRPAVTF